MAGGQEKWYFTKDQLQNSPSRKCGLDADKELAYRQQAANLIQDMGQRLQVYPFIKCGETSVMFLSSHVVKTRYSYTKYVILLKKTSPKRVRQCIVVFK